MKDGGQNWRGSGGHLFTTTIIINVHYTCVGRCKRQEHRADQVTEGGTGGTGS